MIKPEIEQALQHYYARTGHKFQHPKAALFDMDGVLYDSMPGHAKAWFKMCNDIGIVADENEFFAYEGRTGASTINLLYNRQYGHGADDETCRQLYAIKSKYFRELGVPPLMKGAHDAVDAAMRGHLQCVLVTGSGQASILERLDNDYPGAFTKRITAHDVKKGKPDPEPFLKGMELASVEPHMTIAIDNAPLGVQSASSARTFTIGVRTGPIEKGSLMASGADIEINSMSECAEIISQLLLL